MTDHTLEIGAQVLVGRPDLDTMLDALRADGYETIGPTVRDGAIVYDQIATSADLPIGWADEQGGGRYRLLRRDDAACFGYVVGPQSWKPWLHPPLVRQWVGVIGADGVTIAAPREPPPKLAFIGARPCELRAIELQDRVFLDGPYVDPDYRARRERIFVVAVNCGRAGGTCFCASMGSGPRAEAGFDLALTEIIQPGRHVFLAEVGSPAGAALLSDVPHAPAGPADLAAAAQISARAAAEMGRTLDTDGVKELLYQSYEHPRWAEVAERCLGCANCTMVCPTCFCTTVEDVPDLSGARVERVSRWDSCFSLEFSYTAGGPVRRSTRARYRQWLTHKLAAWIDQFGASGCVGCGRCITWCPVGIDITAEVRAIRAQPVTTGGDL